MEETNMIETDPETREQTWETLRGDRVTVFPSLPFSQPGSLGRMFDWRWHVQAANGEIVEQGQGYARRRNARTAALRHHPVVVDGQVEYRPGQPGDKVEPVPAPITPDRTSVELPRHWLAVSSQPRAGQTVLLDGQRREVVYVDGYTDRVVVHLARVTTTDPEA